MSQLSRKIGVVMIDLSGTLHIEDTAIPGAVEALQKLREAKDVKLKFVTNTTKESKWTLVNRLSKAGFFIKETEIFTSLTAARQLLENQNLHPFYLLNDDALEDFKGLHTHKSPTAVVVGLSPQSFNYETMTKAFRLLLDGASLIAIHKARYYKSKDGLALGPGAFISALEYSSGVKAEVVGKPQSSFFLSALRDIGGSPEEAIMIGDDALDDVEGAMKAGLYGCLVKTGKYRANDETTTSPPPTLVANDFPDAVRLILEHNRAF